MADEQDVQDAAGGGRLLAGRYRLGSVLGRGGMGTVWRADDEVLGRVVAVKELRVAAGAEEDEKRRLVVRTLREAKATARIRHTGAVTVYDVVEEDERPWIVMELVESRSLADVIKEDGPLGVERAAEIGLELLGVLAAAHRQGIVHRDVKPSNVLIGEDPDNREHRGGGRSVGGRVVLTDFGIASVEGDPSVTSTGMLVGAPSYISPERAQGRKPTAAADLWSLGATLYAMVEGRPPYDKGSAISTLTAVITEPFAQPKNAGPLRPVIEQMLHKDPEKRLDGPGGRRELRRVLEEVRTAAARAAAEEGALQAIAGVRESAAAEAAPDSAAEAPTRARGRDVGGAGRTGGGKRRVGFGALFAGGLLPGARSAETAEEPGDDPASGGAGRGPGPETGERADGSADRTGEAGEADQSAGGAGRAASAAAAPTAAPGGTGTEAGTDPAGAGPAGGGRPAQAGSDAGGSRAAGSGAGASGRGGSGGVARTLVAGAGGASGASGASGGGDPTDRQGGGDSGGLPWGLTRRGATGLGVLVVVVLVLLGTTLGLLASNGSDKHGSGQGSSGTSGAGASASATPSARASGGASASSGAGGGASASGSASSSAPASAGSSAPASTGGGLPSGFRVFSDAGNHFSIALPSSFKQGGNLKTGGSGVIFTGPGGNSYIEVDWNMEAGMNAQQGLQQLESQSHGGFPDYQRVGLGGSTFKNNWASADWEFKYSNAPVLKHAVTRHFVVDKSHTFNITWITLDKDWSGASARQVLDTLYSSFTFTS